jgi:hypothetical protein
LAHDAAQFRIELLAADDPNGFINSVFRPELVDQVLRLASNILSRAYREATGERVDIQVGPKHRKCYADMLPEAVELAKSLHQIGQRESSPLSFREISARLSNSGQLNRAGKPYHPEEIRRMIKGPRPRRIKS